MIPEISIVIGIIFVYSWVLFGHDCVAVLGIALVAIGFVLVISAPNKVCDGTRQIINGKTYRSCAISYTDGTWSPRFTEEVK